MNRVQPHLLAVTFLITAFVVARAEISKQSKSQKQEQVQLHATLSAGATNK